MYVHNITLHITAYIYTLNVMYVEKKYCFENSFQREKVSTPFFHLKR